MKILWLNWKDHLHPEAGGAEVVLFELSKRFVQDGHKITWLTCNYTDTPKEETINGITILRVGTNRYLHSVQALLYYLRHLRNRFDVVIEVVNTAPYFAVLFGGRSKRILLYHQLARKIWFYETKPPVSQFGHYFLEPLATNILGATNTPTMTISDSTKIDLTRFGFKANNIHIISEGIEIEPVKDLSKIKKYSKLTLLSFGSVRGMKRTMDQIEAFELAKRQIPELQLKIAGSSAGEYGRKALERIAKSPYKKDIEYLGKVSKADKIKLMQKSHLTMQTAVKEGWGLTITEAASQGTPGIVYDVDGLRDSVRHDKTGLVVEESPDQLAAAIVRLLQDNKRYDQIRTAGWQWSKSITFDQAYRDLNVLLDSLAIPGRTSKRKASYAKE